METNLTSEELEMAVRQRVVEHKYWKLIAGELDVAPCTLWRARKTDEWQEAALRVIEEIKAEAFPAAWEGLLEAAQQGDVSACKEILNRIDKAVEQNIKIEHSGEVDHNISEEEYAELLEGLAGISTNGASREGGSGSEA